MSYAETLPKLHHFSAIDSIPDGVSREAGSVKLARLDFAPEPDMRKTALAFALLAATPAAFAYIGPGAGISLVSSVLGVLAAGIGDRALDVR